MQISQDRVVLITGAAAGIGREHALEFARQGAQIVVNDLAPVDDTVAELVAMGARAVGNQSDISSWDGAADAVQTAVAEFGTLHAVVNNAGIIRDRMLVNMSEQEWDDVIRVHLRGTFAVTRHASAYWRERFKAGDPVAHPRIVNTSSPSGLFGNPGQSNYGAAKAGVASFTVIVADELDRIGVGVNAIAPTALTGMTEGLSSYVDNVRQQSEVAGFDVGSPANIAPLAVWLASPISAGITGRVFTINGGTVAVAETWTRGPSAHQDSRWEVDSLSEVIPNLVATARPNSRMNGTIR